MHLKYASRTFMFEHKVTKDIVEINNHQRTLYDSIDAVKHSFHNIEDSMCNYDLVDAFMLNGIHKKENITDKVKSIINIESYDE